MQCYGKLIKKIDWLMLILFPYHSSVVQCSFALVSLFLTPKLLVRCKRDNSTDLLFCQAFLGGNFLSFANSLHLQKTLPIHPLCVDARV
jgi:hypothetical protein